MPKGLAPCGERARVRARGVAPVVLFPLARRALRWAQLLSRRDGAGYACPDPMSSFDLSGIVRFDLDRGRVTLRDRTGANDETSSRTLVPADALASLCRHVSREAVLDFGRRIGTDVGRRVAERLERELNEATPETLLDHLGGEMALLGLGSLRLELWGRAMVFTIESSALLETGSSDPRDPAAELLGAVLEGAIARGLGRDARLLPLSRDARELKLLACNPSTRARVEGWLAEGCHYGEALARLNDAGSPA